MRLITTILVVLFFSVISFGQQADIAHIIPQPLELNPAFAGSYFQYKADVYLSGYYLGITGSPKNIKLSSDIALEKFKSGLGLLYHGEEIGSTKSKIMELAYSFNTLIKRMSLNIGVGVKYHNNRLNFDMYSPDYSSDLVIKNGSLNRLALSGGLLLYNKRFYMSFSYIDQYIYADSEEMEPFGMGVFNIVSGYHFFKGNKISFCPSIYTHIHRNYGNIIKLNLKAMIVNKVWLSTTLSSDEYYEFGVGIDIWNYYVGFREIRPIVNDNYVNSSKLEVFAGFYFDKN
ncbi:MAG: type IX secretion system membrane protein PorP/SprF [Bacteroidales bacterium]|nr:type IX secretion system membrane protein PorP/SprF [Bacteroidales bacterium]